MSKSRDAFRTISEVAEWLDTPAHVLRFWESKFTQVKPVKRAGGRRYYRPSDMELLGGIKKLLHEDGLTIKGAQKVLREQGVRHVSGLSPKVEDAEDDGGALIEDAPFAEVEEQSGEVVSFPTEPAAQTPDLFGELPDVVTDADAVIEHDDAVEPGDAPAPLGVEQELEPEAPETQPDDAAENIFAAEAPDRIAEDEQHSDLEESVATDSAAATTSDDSVSEDIFANDASQDENAHDPDPVTASVEQPSNEATHDQSPLLTAEHATPTIESDDLNSALPRGNQDEVVADVVEQAADPSPIDAGALAESSPDEEATIDIAASDAALTSPAESALDAPQSDTIQEDAGLEPEPFAIPDPEPVLDESPSDRAEEDHEADITEPAELEVSDASADEIPDDVDHQDAVQTGKMQPKARHFGLLSRISDMDGLDADTKRDLANELVTLRAYVAKITLENASDVS